MSHLLVITHPSLVPGFQLAGVEAYGAETAERAKDLIKSWLFDAQPALIAIDETLLEGLDADFLKRINASEDFLIGIPGPSGADFDGHSDHLENSERKQRIEDMVQRAIGFHITFKGTNHD